MEGLEAGNPWARDIPSPKNGQWTFKDKKTELKLGDKVYFWTYAVKNGLGYRQVDGEWTVTGKINLSVYIYIIYLFFHYSQTFGRNLA